MAYSSRDLRAETARARDAAPRIRRLATVSRDRDYKGRARSFALSVAEMDGREPTLILETLSATRGSRIEIIRGSEEFAALEYAIAVVRAGHKSKETT